MNLVRLHGYTGWPGYILVIQARPLTQLTYKKGIYLDLNIIYSSWYDDSLNEGTCPSPKRGMNP
jgi:hypothetical protein